MILHSPYTITIERTSLYFETLDPSYLVFLGFGGIVSRYAEKRFIEKFNELFSKEGQRVLTTDDDMKRLIFNRAYNLLPALHEGLKVGMQVKAKKSIKKDLRVLFNLYKEEFGETFKGDLEPLKTEIGRLRRKLRGFKIEEAPSEKFDFEEIVVNTEMILNQHINRQLKLFQFKKYFDRAAKIALRDG